MNCLELWEHEFRAAPSTRPGMTAPPIFERLLPQIARSEEAAEFGVGFVGRFFVNIMAGRKRLAGADV